MFLIYEQKWIRQWSTVSCCLTPWITLSGRRNASRVFPRPASNPPLPPSLNASRAAETCSNPQIFNGGSRSFHRYQPCPAESWGREPEFTVLFFDSLTCRGQKLKSCCRNAPRSVGETDVKQNSLSIDVEFSQIRLQTFRFFFSLIIKHLRKLQVPADIFFKSKMSVNLMHENPRCWRLLSAFNFSYMQR